MRSVHLRETFSRKSVPFVGALLVLIPAIQASARDIYVDAAATGAANGSSWTNAYTDLQSALTAAVSGDTIHVAKGLYKPTTGTDRTARFRLKNGVTLLGGYPTGGGARDYAKNVTTLTGDIGATGDSSDNGYHVVIGSGTDPSPVLDGFTITGGNANGLWPADKGGGMYNEDGSPTVQNVTFSSNWATYTGGGMANGFGGNPTLTNVTFSGNSADYGGGMENRGSPTLTNVTFSSNSATYLGGGMFNIDSSPTLTNVTFSGNSARSGGGMYNVESSPTLTNVTFSGNSADYGGGMDNYYGSPTLTNVTFSSNSADCGGGMENRGSPTLTNVTFVVNVATDLGGGMYNTDSSPTLTNVTFSGNSAWNGGGMFNIDSSPTLRNVTFSGNSCIYGGGGMSNCDSSPALTNVTFCGNSADWYSGGMGNDSGSTPTVRNTILWGNTPNQIEKNDRAFVTDSVVQGGYAGGTNIITADPRLGPLGNYGGYTQTLPLLPGSSGIDAGNGSNAPATDQRGVSRPQGAGCDIGAYESRGYTLTLTGGNYQSATVKTPFGEALRVSVSSPSGEPVDAGIVTFTAPASGASATFEGSSAATATIAGGAASVNASANGTAGSYIVTASASGAGSIEFNLTNAPDNDPPSIASPKVNPTTLPPAGGLVTISVTAGDVGSGVSAVVATVSKPDGSKEAVNLSASGAKASSVVLSSRTHQVKWRDLAKKLRLSLRSKPGPSRITEAPKGRTWPELVKPAPQLKNGAAQLLPKVQQVRRGRLSASAPTEYTGTYQAPANTGPTTLTYHVRIEAKDAVDNAASADAPDFTVAEGSPPGPPIIVQPANGAVVNTAKPATEGTAEAGATIEILEGSMSLGTATADSSGKWTLTPATALTDGSHTLTAKATDAAGNVSAASHGVTFTVDTAVPAAPVITQPMAGAVLSLGTPTIMGTAEAGSKVEVFEGTASLGATIADSAGNWSLALMSALTDGPHTVTAKTTDAAGNVSPLSQGVSFTVDVTTLFPPVILKPTKGAWVSTTKPVIEGTARPGATVDVSEGKKLLGTTTVDANGKWSLTPTKAFSQGPHTVTAKAKDSTGKTSEASEPLSFTVDTKAPKAPAISRPKKGAAVNATRPVLEGTAEAGATVEVFEGTTSLGTTKADSNRKWSLTPAQVLSEGQHTVTAKATDAAGNVSTASKSVTFTVDTTPPTVTACSGTTKSVKVVFSESVNSTDAKNKTNYTVTVGGAATAVSSVTYSSGSRTATIKVNMTLQSGAAVSVRVTGVRDLAGNVIVDNGTTNVGTTTVPKKAIALRLTNLQALALGRSSLVQWVLTSEALVQVRILSPQGRLVHVLGPVPARAGLNACKWDGRMRTGRLAGRGRYVIEVLAQDGEGRAVRAVRSVYLR